MTDAAGRVSVRFTPSQLLSALTVLAAASFPDARVRV